MLGTDALRREPCRIPVETDGVVDKLASEIDATGTITGQNVPIEAVRSFSTIIGIMARTFFGA